MRSVPTCGIYLILAPSPGLACPHCQQLLSLTNEGYLCGNRHHFDIARGGYINLLPAHFKRSKSPGDSTEMIGARRRIMDSGLFEPVSTRLNTAITDYLTQLPDERLITILDAGCGEGYYLDRLASVLATAEKPGAVSLAGLDISQPAIQMASRRTKAVTWLVASNRSIPMPPASVDVVLCIFGFPSYRSFKTVLRSDGRLMVLGPGPRHLHELRVLLYEHLPKEKAAPVPTDDFCVADHFNVTFTCRVQGQDLDDLLRMTPHFFRTSQARKQALSDLPGLSLTIDVSCHIWEPT
jgi:23S rRNA (guanine745-N1)-methyltransferase